MKSKTRSRPAKSAFRRAAEIVDRDEVVCCFALGVYEVNASAKQLDLFTSLFRPEEYDDGSYMPWWPHPVHATDPVEVRRRVEPRVLALLLADLIWKEKRAT